MAQPQKLPSGKWRIRIYLGKNEKGKKQYYSITGSQREVKKKAKEIMEMIKDEQDVTNITVGEAITKYIGLKTNILSPTTIKGYQSIRRNNLKTIMNVSLLDLTNAKIQQAINIEAILHCPKTVHNIHGLLSSALSVYRPEFVLHTTLPKNQKQSKYIPTPKDINRLLSITYNTDMYIPVILASMLSLRRSEVCGLIWSNIDIKRGKITVTQAKVYNPQNKYVIKAPKTYTSYRTLTMPLVLIDALKKQEDKTGFVVQMSPSALSCKFAKIVKQNKFEHFTFHSLRHFNASVMLALNLPDKYAMERGGWATPNVMKSVYQHTFKAEQEKYDKVLIEYFGNLYHPLDDTQMTQKNKKPRKSAGF